MKKKLFFIVLILGLFGVWAWAGTGTLTNNGFIYKPAENARGAAEKTLYDAGLDRIDTRLGRVIYVGDPHYLTFAAAVASLNAVGTSCTLIVPVGTHSVAADLTVNSNIQLSPLKGCDIAVASGKTLTLVNTPMAGPYQIFSGAGTVVIQGNGIQYAEWGHNPGVGVQIGNGVGTNSVDPTLNINRNVDDTGSGNSHGFTDSSTITRGPSPGAIGYAGYDSRYIFSGTANFDHTAGYQFNPTYSSSGTITNVYGLFTALRMTTGTVSNNYGIYCANPDKAGGTLTNTWGIYVAEQTVGTNKYAAGFEGTTRFLGVHPRIELVNPSDSYNVIKLITNATADGYLAQEGASGNEVLTGGAAYAVELFNGSAFPLHLGTDGAVRLTIGATGNVSLVGTTAGFIPHKVTTTQRNALSATEGMTVYDTTLHTLCFHNGTNWQKVTSSNAD